MLFRSAADSDLDRILSFGSDDPLNWPETSLLRGGIADGSWRLSRTWLALDGDDLMAMARFWTPPGHDGKPASLDGLYVHTSISDRAALAAELLRHTHRELGVKPAYHMFLPANWREDAAAGAVAWRRAALTTVGMTRELERLRYKWTPEAGVPKPDSRLEFRPADDAAFLDAFCQISQASLDAGTQQGIAANGVEAEAREHMGVYLEMPGERDWWRLAYAPDGDLVGLEIPSANNGGPVVGYLGVVPRHRGKGYVDVLLSEMTRFLAETGAQWITADTDTTNFPMAAAFERAGYEHFATRLVVDAPA